MARLSESFEPPRARPAAGRVALQQALFALQMQRPAEAESIAAEVLKANRSDVQALQILGHALLLQGRAGEAVERLEKASRRVEDAAIDTQLAVALRAVGRNDEALDRLRRATLRRPPFAPAFIELGQQLVALERHDEAVDALKRGGALFPENTDLAVQLGYLFAARGDRTSARAILSRALTLDPNRIDAMYALANAMQTDGDYAAAAETFRRLLGHKPDHAAARIGLGLCLLELRDSDAGLTCLRQAMRAGPRMFGQGLSALAGSPHGRFWLRPSDAARFAHGGAA